MICDEQSPSASARLRPGHGVEGTRARGRWGRLSSRIKRCRVVGGERGRMTFQRREPAAVTLPGDPGSHPKPRGYQAPPDTMGREGHFSSVVFSPSPYLQSNHETTTRQTHVMVYSTKPLPAFLQTISVARAQSSFLVRNQGRPRSCPGPKKTEET